MLITEDMRKQVKEVLLRASEDITVIVGRKVTVECKEWQDGSLSAQNEKDELLRKIICEVCEVTWEQVTDKSRKRDVVIARHLYCHFAYKWVRMSYGSIGEIVGGRDHTTALHACQAVKDALDSNNFILQQYHKSISIKIKAASL